MNLDILHIWDGYVGSSRKDLHSEMRCRPDIRSRQCVRLLEATSAAVPPETLPLRVIGAGGDKSGFVARLRNRLDRTLSWAQYRAFIAAQLRTRRPDVLHAHFGTNGWEFCRLAEQTGLPLVVSFYGVDVSQMVREPLWQKRYAEMFPRAARLVVLCQEAKDRLVALGCPAEKIRIWNQPLDMDAYEYRPRSPQATVRLITGARFVEKKGYPFMLQACAELVRAGRDITLTAVGYGTMRDSIRQQADSLGLSERFRLVDTTGMNDFDAFYNGILHEHDIFMLPSTVAKSGDDEGGPALSLVLAQAAGLPVICTPFIGAERTVLEGETGLYCRQDDAASLAERIAFLADRPELWNRLGGAGSALVRREFGFPRQIEEMVGIYRDAVKTVSTARKR